MSAVRQPIEPGATSEVRISDEQKKAFEKIWSDETGFSGHFREINNTPIAKRYMIAGFTFFLFGGLEALLLRIQLGTPDNTFLSAEAYNQIFTMHGTTMMFLFVIPFIEALANYMLPLLVGTRDLPFPRLTALSYWTYVFGGIFLYSSFLIGAAPDGGWFSYMPLNSKEFSPGINMDFWDIGLSVAEVAALGAAAELIVGILRMRAAGMTLDRLPLFAWAMLVTAFMIIFAFTPLIVGTTMLELDRKEMTTFFEPSAGGEPLLWQHLFWVFGHPEVYIMFIPAVGIVSHVVQTFTRRPLVSYTAMVLSTIATGFISFGLWVHHMFTTGLSPLSMGFFTAASLLIVIPNGVQVFGWIATLWFGRPRLTVPLLYVFGFLVIFVLGGLTGVMTASVPVDAQIHDSHFVVAHFHYVLIGGVIFPMFAGLYYWLPKITGHMLSERLGKWNFWMMFVFFNVAFLPMHISGMLGMPRRVYTYDPGMGLEIPNLISTVGALGFATGISLFLINLLWSRKHGAEAGRNPWGGESLEWSEESPPSDAQYAQLPVVTSRHPLWDQVTLHAAHTPDARAVRALDWAPVRWRGAMCVSVLEARPLGIVHMPVAQYWPFLLSVGFLFVFIGALVERLWPAALGALLTAIALAGWFWPQKTQAIAIEERDADGRACGMPLITHGPVSNGWWGTLVLISVLATALATFVASYYYLIPTTAPRAQQELAWPALLALIALGMTIAGFATLRSVRTRSRAWRVIGLLAALLLHITSFVISFEVYKARPTSPKASAFESAILGLYGFQWVVTVMAAVMLVWAAVWALRAPDDDRGLAPADNASLVSMFVSVSWLVTLAVVHLDAWVRWNPAL